MKIACRVCGAEHQRGPDLSYPANCTVCGEPEGLWTAVEMLGGAAQVVPVRRCVHCGKPGAIDVPIDNDGPDENGLEIRAWSCADCVHKRVRWESSP